MEQRKNLHQQNMLYMNHNLDTSNFREFNAVIKNASPIEKNINLLKQAASDSNTKVTILTARGLGYPVKKYLKDEFNLDLCSSIRQQ
jgi:biotin synthase-like enzyme